MTDSTRLESLASVLYREAHFLDTHRWDEWLSMYEQYAFFGRYEHRLRRQGGHWQIARKKIVLMNERLPTMIDFYCV